MENFKIGDRVKIIDGGFGARGSNDRYGIIINEKDADYNKYRYCGLCKEEDGILIKTEAGEHSYGSHFNEEIWKVSSTESILQYCKRNKNKIKIEIEVTDEQIKNILHKKLHKKLEFGVNWCKLDDGKDSTKASEIILRGDYIDLIDCENNNLIYRLKIENILNGIELNYKERPYDCDLNNLSIYGCDYIIQYGLFGKIIYR